MFASLISRLCIWTNLVVHFIGHIIKLGTTLVDLIFLRDIMVMDSLLIP